MGYFQQLEKRQHEKKSLLCAGLDIDLDKIPACFTGSSRFVNFGDAFIEAVAPHVAVIKINFAFIARRGMFLELNEFVHKAHHLGLLVILDGKFGDIGNSSEMWAGFAFDYVGADAVTVHPYMGGDSVKPFLDYADKGVYVLCRTSNESAKDFQSLEVVHSTLLGGTAPLYQVVAERAKQWNRHGNCGLVIGATAPSELNLILEKTDYMASLIPGVGAQGGKESDIVPLFGKSITTINQSRSLMYPKKAYETKSPDEYVQIVGTGAAVAAEEINKYVTITGGY
ncbi:MAG TPA: orotidine-5'-phosphate decarboxylase [Candidatus Fimivivens sp.]|nr:orotidine-5'-phosphate decarboxylase [Candidatus Fimivivens sp.]